MLVTKRIAVALLMMILVGISQASAGVIIDLLGDKDGFGVPGAPAVPADGTLWRDGLGGVFFTDYRSVSDPAFTDNWAAPGGFNYTHTYSLGGSTALGGVLNIQIAGIHDINLGTVYNFMVDGMTVGVIPPNPTTNAFQEVKMYSFPIPAPLLNGSDSINVSGTGGDGYIINFSELIIRTADAPEPATMLLLGAGFVGLTFSRRRR